MAFGSYSIYVSGNAYQNGQAQDLSAQNLVQSAASSTLHLRDSKTGDWSVASLNSSAKLAAALKTQGYSVGVGHDKSSANTTLAVVELNSKEVIVYALGGNSYFCADVYSNAPTSYGGGTEQKDVTVSSCRVWGSSF